MLPLRYVGRWRVAGAMLLVCVLAGAMLPALWLLPDIRLGQLVGFDKWLHVIAFAVLTVWFCGQYARASYGRVAAALLVFGSLIEICQFFIVYRAAEWQDLYADGIGIVIGLIIAVVGAGGWSLRMEHWLIRRRQVDY